MKYDLSELKEQARLIERINGLIKKEAKVELKEIKDSRSNLQNRYLYACFKVLSDYSGYTSEEIKEILKANCDIMNYKKGGHTFLRSTADLDTKEMTIFIDFIRAFGLEFDCYIFSPDEYYKNSFEYDNKLGI